MLVGAVMGFWSVQRFHPTTWLSLAGGSLVAALRRGADGVDPRVPLDHAPREPDRLRPRADDLRGRGRASRPTSATTSTSPTCRRRTSSTPSSPPRCRSWPDRRADRLRPERARLPLLGARGRAHLLPQPDPAGPQPAGRGRVAGGRRRDGDQRGAPTGTHTRSPVARSPAVAGATFTLAITPQWVDGITGGAGWIAIALVIFAFWRPELCLVGAYFFGVAAGARARAAGAADQPRPDGLLDELTPLRRYRNRSRADLGQQRAPAARRPRRRSGLAYTREER